MQRDVLVMPERPDLLEAQIDLVLDAAAGAQAVFTKVALGKAIPFIGIWHLAVRPEVWRNVATRMALRRIEALRCAQSQFERQDQRLVQALNRTGISPSDDVRRDPGSNHDGKADSAEDQSDWTCVVGTENDMLEVPLRSGRENEADVHDRERDIPAHQQEMD